MSLRRSDGIPRGTASQRPGSPTEGTLFKNLTTNNIEYYDGTAWRDLTVVGTPSKSVTLENPTDAEDFGLFFADTAITITAIRAVLVGSSTPSVTWTIRHGTDRSAAGSEVVTSGTTTTSITSGSDVTSFNDATVLADSFVWLETTAQSGTVDAIELTIFYTVDA